MSRPSHVSSLPIWTPSFLVSLNTDAICNSWEEWKSPINKQYPRFPHWEPQRNYVPPISKLQNIFRSLLFLQIGKYQYRKLWDQLRGRFQWESCQLPTVTSVEDPQMFTEWNKRPPNHFLCSCWNCDEQLREKNGSISNTCHLLSP